jgi:hypothetical protein
MLFLGIRPLRKETFAMTYQAPKKALHRDFTYLNHDAVINSLSALEAGKVDEIIEKASSASDRGFSASLNAGPAKGGAARKKQAEMQFELVRTRTRFSAFEEWHRHLIDEEALGKLTGWSEETRGLISVGDTIEFRATVSVSPVYLMMTSYQSYMSQVNKTGSPFKMSGQEFKEAKSTLSMMTSWVSGSDGSRSITAYFAPEGISFPRVVGQLDERYLIGGLDGIEGDFSVIAQVDSLINPGSKISAIRALKDVPATPLEVETVEEGLRHFQGEAAENLGLKVADDDIAFSHPTVMIRPLAAYK